MKKFENVFLIFILLLSSILSVSMLTRGHNWGDDFAAYLMQAQNLINGTTREFILHNTFTIQQSSPAPGPVAYPWGYPLLLAPALTIFGLRLSILKLVNTVFYAFFLIVFYRLLRLRFPSAWALFLMAIFAFNPALLQARDEILSDIPFLFFSTLTLCLIEKYLSPEGISSSILPYIAIGASIFAAFAIRVNGLLLLSALAAAQFLHFGPRCKIYKNLTAILLPYLTLGLLAALQFFLLPHGQVSYFEYYSGLTPSILLGNAKAYPELLAEMFRDIPLSSMFTILLQLFFFIGLFSDPFKNAAFATYIFLLLGTLVTWPYSQTLRFIFPILPPIALVAAEGWRSTTELISAQRRPIAGRTGIGLAATLVIMSLSVSAGQGWVNLQNGREIIGPFDAVSAPMFEFMRQQTPSDSVVIFFKPRALRLLTNRDTFRTVTCENFSKGDYVVFHKQQGSNGQVAEPEACTNVSLKPVFNNQHFTVYQVNP